MVKSAYTAGHSYVGRVMNLPTGLAESPPPQAEPIVSLKSARRNLNVCIVAAKDLSWNTRVVRQAKVLRDAGHNVTVISLIAPAEELMATATGTDFLTIGHMDFVISAAIKRRLSKILKPMVARWRSIAQAVMSILLAPIWILAQAMRTFRFVPSRRNIDQRERGSRLTSFLRRSPYWTSKQSRVMRRFLTQIRRSLRRFQRFVIQRQRVPSVSRLANFPLRLVRRLLRAVPGHAPMTRSIAFAQYASLALAERDFDCVQAHDSHALRGAWKVARVRRACFVYDAVEIPDDRSGLAAQRNDGILFRVNSALEASIIRRADKIITVSNGLAEWTATRYGIEQPDLVRNCRLYEVSRFDDRIKRAVGLHDGECLALYLNSLYSGQGLEQLVQSLSFLSHHIHIATLGPVQESAIADRLISIAKSVGALDRFHILDPVPPTDVVAYASGADIGVIPRQNSCLNNAISLPNRVFELIMARLPIAAPSLPDMKSFVAEYGIGLSFDETDAEDIARIVSEMLQPDRLAEFRANVEVAARELCWESEGAKYVRILEDAANGRRFGA